MPPRDSPPLASYSLVNQDEKGYFDSPTSSTFGSDRNSDDGSQPTRPVFAARRRSSVAWKRMRHSLLGRYAKVVLGGAVLLALLHQLMRPPTSTSLMGVVSPTFASSDLSFRGAMDKTLSRVGWKTDKDDPYVTALQARLANAPVPPYRFLVGTMEHNEAKDIVEWLLYHISQGMEHFVVYDHFSTDETRELLRPFEDLGWVTFVPFNHEGRWAQPVAFDHFVADYKTTAKWLFFFDIDEFVARNETLLAGTGELDEPFVDWFDRKYSDFGGVSLGRIPFSSNGHYTRPAEGTLAGYTEARAIDRNFFAPKVVSQARYKLPGGDIHKQEFEGNLSFVDPNGKSGEQRWEDKGSYPVYLHHYWARSWEECVTRIKQRAFPGSWREVMGDSFCRLEMRDMEDWATLEHHQDHTLAKYAPALRTVADWFQQKYPTLETKDYALSTLVSSGLSSSGKRIPYSPSSTPIEPGTTFVVDYARGAAGFLDVVLVTKETRQALPVSYRSDGGASFTIPPPPPSAFASTPFELVITLQHPASPNPALDSPNPCSIMGHIKNRPEVLQLQQLQNGVCKETNLDTAWHLAQQTYPHNHYRGEVLFRRFFRLAPSASPAAASLSLSSATPSPLAHLGQGHWQAYPLWDFPAAETTSSAGRLYTTERCPHRFSSGYWDDVCGLESNLTETGGVKRWIPTGASSWKDVALPPSEIKTCLFADDPEPIRIVLVGDSVSSHTYMALQCLFDQAGLDVGRHVRFSNFQYEAFSFNAADFEGATGTDIPPLSKRDWERIVAWEYDADEEEARSFPDVVVFNNGLWPISGMKAHGYELGLRSAVKNLRELSNEQNGFKLVLRETTSVFPFVHEGDPLQMVNPRVRLFNEIIRDVVDEANGSGGAKVSLLPTYEMTAPRRDKAKDTAHMCPVVQGDLAEVLLSGICRDVLGGGKK
ncbi:hypothetical protein JCM8097_002901 [Rhodosporidiobolus ruineniae]